MLMAGAMKLGQSKEQLRASGNMVDRDVAPGRIKGIGTLEALAATGLTAARQLHGLPMLCIIHHRY
jgi:hypothetical protein